VTLTGSFIALRLPFRNKSALALPDHASVPPERIVDIARFAGRRRRAGESREGRDMAKTVLIVEDNELNMKLFHDLLEAHGYKTVGTRNGIEALDLARKHRPDLILMDIQLPEVSGLEVTKWLKDDQELKAIPVVAVTAFAMKGDEERIREGGCEAYLSKPISVGKFIETIRHFLGNA
jgi:two-component system cell cycle response regulator DivK